MKQIDLDKLFEIAGENAQGFEKELHAFYQLLYKNFELRVFFEDQSFTKESKKKLFLEICPSASKLFNDFIVLLIDNDLTKEIMKTAVKYSKLISQKEKIIFVDVASAFPLSGEDLEKIKDFAGQNITMRVEIDPLLVAGIKILCSDGRFFDGSLKGRLLKLKGEISNA